jgi:hypothetical protein
MYLYGTIEVAVNALVASFPAKRTEGFIQNPLVYAGIFV